MSLNWDVSKVKDHDEVTTWIPDHDDPSGRYKAGMRMWNPVTETLALLTITTGIRQITADNAAEFYARLNLIERVNGAMMIRAEVDGVRPEGWKAFITPAEVRQHVGLSTNASTKTRAQFLKTFEYDMKEATRRYVESTAEVGAA